ncbi:hypothetical protein ACQJBY_008058 [Aegilops geniculata]
MLHEEKAAAIKRLMKKGQLPAQLTEVDENGNRWPTKEALISAKKVDFGTDVGWRLLCEHWSGAEFRGLSLRNKRNRLANGDTVFHCSGARNVVATRQFLGKTLEFLVLGFTRTICIEGPTKRRFAVKELPIIGLVKSCDLAHFNHHENYLHNTLVYINFLFEKEDFDKAMKNAHGENWEEENPDLDGQIIYEAAGRMPHGRLGIANELFSKAEKAKFKSKRVMASQPVRSAREERLERENKHLKQENKRLRGIELVVQSLAEKGGVDFDGIMQSAVADLSASDSEGGIRRGRGGVHQSEPEKGMGSRTGGSTSHGTDDEDDYYGSKVDDDYGEGDLYGDEPYDYYGGEGYNDYEDEEYNEYGNDNDDWP